MENATKKSESLEGFVKFFVVLEMSLLLGNQPVRNGEFQKFREILSRSKTEDPLFFNKASDAITKLRASHANGLDHLEKLINYLEGLET